MQKFYIGLCMFKSTISIRRQPIFSLYSRGNIPGNQIDKGETLCSYLPTFPAKGTGWHRCVFMLYKHQHGRINYSELYGSLPGNR